MAHAKINKLTRAYARGEEVTLHIDGVYRPEHGLNGYWEAAAYKKVVVNGVGRFVRLTSKTQHRHKAQAQVECDGLNASAEAA
jgi:hypothetical protein